MKTENIIYENLADSRGRDVRLRDFIDNECNLYHSLVREGRVPSHTRYGGLLLAAVDDKVLEIVEGYFEGAFDCRLRGKAFTDIAGISVNLSGLLPDGSSLVVTQVTAASVETRKPSIEDITYACIHASLLGTESALLVTLDRGGQLWSMWRIAGISRRALEETRLRVRAYEGFLYKSCRPQGSASRSDCKRCPIVGSCPADDILAPHSRRTCYETMIRDRETESKLNSYLASLNSLPSGRATHVIHPSEISTSPCDRRIYYGLGGEHRHNNVGPKLRRVFDTGHAVHAVIQGVLSETCPGFREEVEVKDKALRIAGHADGVFEDPVGLEIKSIGQKGFDSLTTSAKSDHKKQGTIYCSVLGLPSMLYLYVCKTTGEIRTYLEETSKRDWLKIKARAMSIVAAHAASSPPERIESGYACKGCPFNWKCKPSEYSLATREEKRRF